MVLGCYRLQIDLLERDHSDYVSVGRHRAVRWNVVVVAMSYYRCQDRGSNMEIYSWNVTDSPMVTGPGGTHSIVDWRVRHYFACCPLHRSKRESFEEMETNSGCGDCCLNDTSSELVVCNVFRGKVMKGNEGSCIGPSVGLRCA